MKYKIDVAVLDYQNLYNGKHLQLINSSGFAGIYEVEYKHKATGVIIHLQETMERLDHLFAESNDEEAMNNFKDHILLLGID